MDYLLQLQQIPSRYPAQIRTRILDKKKEFHIILAMKILTLFFLFFTASFQAYIQEPQSQSQDGFLLDSRADCVPAGGKDISETGTSKEKKS